MEAGELLGLLGVDPAQGLDPAEVHRRRHAYGPNALRGHRPRHVLAILADQFRGLVVLLLAVAAALALAYGDLAEGIAILIVLAINSAIGFLTEWRATRSMEALRQLGHVTTTVRRKGRMETVRAEDLVPGDIVTLQAGDLVTADLRLLEAAKLAADESTLTGESAPVAKQLAALPVTTTLMERDNCLFKGTLVTRGSGLGVVAATGLATELGRIAELVSGTEAQVTPLERRLDALGRKLVWVTLGLTGLIALAGIFGGREIRASIEVAIALAVAAIPEGLPIVATIALARGMWRMAQRNALIVRLSAVETLGATGVILTDKTGTLTENRMAATRIELPGQPWGVRGAGLRAGGDFAALDGPASPADEALLDGLLTAAALCNNASLQLEASGEARVVGDPTETALLVAAARRGLQRESLLERLPELREEPFDPAAKAMATFNRTAGGLTVFAKGAPETLIDACTRLRTTEGDQPLDEVGRARLHERAAALAGDGLRTLVVATRPAATTEEEPYHDLVYLGLIGLLDPPRPGVREALDRCREAGIRVVMVTGDHAATAFHIARATGLAEPGKAAEQVIDGRSLADQGIDVAPAALEETRVFARVTPRQKLELIDRYQRQGQVVAMTGDGVNDAPALKKADIGVAMGLRGTQVARDAAAMVLQDDELATIVEAVAQGRAIHANLRKFVVYLLSCNISEILIVGLATVAGAPLPLLPLQILFLNLVTDVFPALALGVGASPPGLMRQRPRPAGEPILATRHWTLVALHGLVMAAAVLGAMAVAMTALGHHPEKAVSVSFLTLALAQLWHVFNMRDRRSRALHNEITGNPWVWGALALCLVLIILAMALPGLRGILRLASPGAAGWALVLAFSLVPLLVGPLVRSLAARLDVVRGRPGHDLHPE